MITLFYTNLVWHFIHADDILPLQSIDGRLLLNLLLLDDHVVWKLED